MTRICEVWAEGFRAGEQFGRDCPYPSRTQEYAAWYDGWREGFAKRSGFPYSRSKCEKDQRIKHDP